MDTSGALSFDRVAARYNVSRSYPPGVADTIARGLISTGPLDAGTRLLELAAGTGRTTIPLLAAGVPITALDISPRMLAILRQDVTALQAAHDPTHAPLGQLTIREGDMTTLSDPDASWDAVLAVHIFHLVAAWRRALDEALRVLSPEGVLLLGQDRAVSPVGDDPRNEIADCWREIVAEMGVSLAATEPPGAGYDAVLADLRERDLPVEERTLATWVAHYTPRATVAEITSRSPSWTWAVPDDAFAASAKRLDAWAASHYGPRRDVPMPLEMAFVVARVTRQNG